LGSVAFAFFAFSGCMAGASGRVDLQGEGSKFAQICSDLLKFEQICSNLLNVGLEAGGTNL
jgi:hypothetical protein